MTRAKSYDEDVEECTYFLIQPDPSCPECTTIMDWRAAHRGIVLTNAADIRLSDYGWETRHLHVRDVRDAHHKLRKQQRKEWERKERFHSVT